MATDSCNCHLWACLFVFPILKQPDLGFEWLNEKKRLYRLLSENANQSNTFCIYL